MKPSVSLPRAGLAAIALCAAAASAQAQAISLVLNFDDVAAGSNANSALGAAASFASFANPDTVLDVDASGSYTGTFHWVDATSSYGPVLVTASLFAISGSNVLSNDGQPILLLFNNPLNLAQFSIQQDGSGFGNPQTNGTVLSFLDSTGHVIAGADVAYTQFGHPGLTISSGAVANVSGVLLAGGKSYDNLSLVAAPVPEPGALALFVSGLGAVGTLSRRRRTPRA